MHYILESTFARILLFIELPFLQGGFNLPQKSVSANVRIQAPAAKGEERITYDNGFILIGQSKQCARMRETRGVLKIKRYAQRLTHRVCMGDGGSS